MASGKIRKSDLVQGDALKAVTKEMSELKGVTDEIVKGFAKLGAEAKKINKAIKNVSSFKQLANEAKKAEENAKGLTAEEKRLLKVNKELALQTSDYGKKLAKAQNEVNKARKANRDYAKSQDAAKKSTNTFGKALKSFAFKFNALGNIAANVASKITQFAKKVIKDGLTAVIKFDQAMADVKAVSSATADEFDRLRESAKELGATTKFTATEVALLQKEYAKLGFSTDAILDMQAATLQLATATGGDLGQSAKIVGGALRAFGKDTKDASKVGS